MRRLYFLCNSPHIFSGQYCPQDGWSQFWAGEILAAVERLERDGTSLSLHALCAVGVPAERLSGVLVIDFASEPTVFDALAIAGTYRDGAWKPEWEAVSFLQQHFGSPGHRPFPSEVAGDPDA